MQLHPGFGEEYRRRHAAIWPELVDLLHESGVSEYSIFLNEGTMELIGVLRIDDPGRLDELPANEVMQRWWDYMKDIMDTNPDHSPVTGPLKEVFYMP